MYCTIITPVSDIFWQCERGDILYSKLATAVTKKLSELDVIDKDKFEIYSYSFEVLISYSVYFVVFLLISLLTKTFFVSLCFLVGFCILRHFAGGYHTSTYLRCHLLFSFTHLLFILLYRIVLHQWYLVSCLFLILFIVLCVFIFAPVDNVNKPFTEKEFKQFRFKSRLYIGLMSTILITASIILHIVQPYIWSFVVGTSFAATSLLVAKMIEKHSTPQ